MSNRRAFGINAALRRPPGKLWLTLAAIAVFLAVADRPAFAIELGEVLWGFDGQATKNTFVPLSVLVINPSSKTFEGSLELRKRLGNGSQVDAPLREEVYLSPNSSRWIQFYPYINEEWNEWSLHWGPAGLEKIDLAKPRLGEQAPILLYDPDEIRQRSAGLKRFAENLFPPFVSATDSLKTVALDHVPRWEESRRQAFIDWLSRGGRLHLFKGIDGGYPKFSGTLAPLNVPLDEFRVGAGQVNRHDRRQSQIDDALVRAISPAPDAPTKKKPAKAAEANGRAPLPNSYDELVGDVLFPDLTGGIFTILKRFTRPHHKWYIIYFMSFVYVLAVFPGLYLFGRRQRDYRLVYAALFGTVAFFSVGFAQVGRRGQGEATSVKTVAVVQELPPTLPVDQRQGSADATAAHSSDATLDITSWSNVFVVGGGTFAISHTGSGRFYSTAQSVEAVHGAVYNGAQGAFIVEIPSYSSRSFIERMQLRQPRFDVRVQELSGGAALSKLLIVTGANFPKSIDSSPIFALDRNGLYQLKQTKRGLELGGGRQTLEQFFQAINRQDFAPYSAAVMRFDSDEEEATLGAQDSLQNLLRPLIVSSLRLERHGQLPNFSLPDDRLRLFVFADLPENLKIDGQQFGAQSGRVLYVIDVPKTNDKRTTP